MTVRPTIYLAAALIAVAAWGKPAESQAAEVAFDAAVSGEYATDPFHRYITFSYVHRGLSRAWLRWRDWDATLNWDAENPEASSVEVLIDAKSIDSGVDLFDEHLRDERFFDVANHPEITFVSTGIERTDEDEGVIAGELTIKGVTRPVSLDVTFNKASFDQRSGHKLGFSGKTVINRSDFGLDYAVPIVGDEVEILIETQFVMAADDSE